MWIKEHYRKGELDGEYIVYYENGTVYIKSTYKNGNRDGEYIEYYKNGNV
ncbi:MAG: hypothetical protein ACP5SP_08100 [Caldisericum sp.]